MEPDLEAMIGLPTETSSGTAAKFGRSRSSTRNLKNDSPCSSWTKTEIRYMKHFHDWTVKGFGQLSDSCRYLETSFTVKDNSTSSAFMEPLVNHTYKIRLHPQGNKSSNLEFTFFQIFSLAQNAKFKAKFYVYNSNNEEIPTTVYSGNQNLNGFFQYLRRSDLLRHIEADDELRLSVMLTSYSDTLMQQGNYAKKEPLDVIYQDDSVLRDYQSIFNNERFSDFKIYCGPRKQVLHVHRAILAARCQYFSALLSTHTKEYSSGTLELVDVDFEVFSELVFWLYTGNSPNIRLYALDLLILCDRFGLTQLKDLSARILKGTLRTDNVCEILTKAELHDAPELKEATLNFIIQNSTTVLKTPQWETLLAEQPKLVTEIFLAMSKQSAVEPLSKRIRVE